MSDIDNIVFDGEYMNLNSLPMERLKEILNKVDEKEKNAKQELNELLKKLV